MDTDLKKLILMNPSAELNREHVKITIYNILCAFKFMETANIVHRDIKPANILVDKYC